jgi:hypothetical protein
MSRSYDISLTLAGIIDEDDARILDGPIDPISPNYGQSILELLRCGEREFFPFLQSTTEAPTDVALALREMSISYAFYWVESRLDIEIPQAGLEIFDPTLGRLERFTLADDQISLSAEQQNGPVVVEMSQGWRHVDEYPDLYFVQSRHDAMRLLESDATLIAAQHYFDRKASCTTAALRFSS